MPEDNRLDVLARRIRQTFESEVRDALDKYKHAVDARVCAEIDAGACRTARDYAHRNKMQDAEAEVQEQVTTELVKLMALIAANHKLGIL